ncbi:hypothetical protein GVAV_002081 [Gurleya vavrai]
MNDKLLIMLKETTIKNNEYVILLEGKIRSNRQHPVFLRFFDQLDILLKKSNNSSSLTMKILKQNIKNSSIFHFAMEHYFFLSISDDQYQNRKIRDNQISTNYRTENLIILFEIKSNQNDSFTTQNFYIDEKTLLENDLKGKVLQLKNYYESLNSASIFTSNKEHKKQRIINKLNLDSTFINELEFIISIYVHTQKILFSELKNMKFRNKNGLCYLDSQKYCQYFILYFLGGLK